MDIISLLPTAFRAKIGAASALARLALAELTDEQRDTILQLLHRMENRLEHAVVSNDAEEQAIQKEAKHLLSKAIAEVARDQ